MPQWPNDESIADIVSRMKTIVVGQSVPMEHPFGNKSKWLAIHPDPHITVRDVELSNAEWDALCRELGGWNPQPSTPIERVVAVEGNVIHVDFR